ncbi:hypothetical protein XaC1_447 [Xanthomonas phage XaC1]|nr:hypothetical protein XaC1_447 [Xanthomonas phage XaC1]
MYNLKVIKQVLEMIQNPLTRREYHGIWFNLKFYYEDFADVSREQSNKDVSHFMKDCLTSLYGEYIPYPLEANSNNPRREHYRIEKKWSKDCKTGKERVELLKKMIQYCNSVLEMRIQTQKTIS